jgi:hypothetical protein
MCVVLCMEMMKSISIVTIYYYFPSLSYIDDANRHTRIDVDMIDLLMIMMMINIVINR